MTDNPSKPGPKAASKRESTNEAGKPRIPDVIRTNAAALAKWRELTKVLFSRGTLTRADGTQLEIICRQYATWLKCQEEIEANGVMVETSVLNSSGVEIIKRIVNPALKVATGLENSMRATLQTLGATPSTRERVKPARAPLNKQPLAPDSVGVTTDFDAVWDAAGKQLKKSQSTEEAETYGDELGGAGSEAETGGGGDE